jgi:hypothetical protein
MPSPTDTPINSGIRGARVVLGVAAVTVACLSAWRRDWWTAAFWTLFGATYWVLPLGGARPPVARWRKPLGVLMVAALLVIAVVRIARILAPGR